MTGPAPTSTRVALAPRSAAALLLSTVLVHSACRREPSASPTPTPPTTTEYYDHVLREFHRCFSWRGDEDLGAVVAFVVARDGTVSEARLVEDSGDPGFDRAALDAVACVQRAGGLGPLPPGVPGDELPIQFHFGPRGRDRVTGQPPPQGPLSIVGTK